MTDTLEKRVAMTILEKPVGEFILAGKTYSIPAPTTATMVAVSGLISELPQIDLDVPERELTAEGFRHGGAGLTLARIAATFILGARKPGIGRRIRDFIGRRPSMDRLTRLIAENMTYRQLRELLFPLIADAGMLDFFVITTSLRGGNLLKPTREVEN